MRLIIFLIEAGVFLLALYVLARYVVGPIIEYVTYVQKRVPRIKTPEEIDRELELQRKKRELDRMRLERSDDLVEHLDSIFEEAHRHQPRRKTQSVK